MSAVVGVAVLSQVNLNPGGAHVEARAQTIAQTAHGALLSVYSVIKGFAIRLAVPGAEALLRHNPQVALVEPNRVFTATTVENAVPWGLDRIDQRSRPLNAQYRYGSDGTGVSVYIIDTGIRTSHSDLRPRASVGFDALGGNGQDCNGHGTHVAGIAGGTIYGVAKKAALVAVRVLDCGGGGTTRSVLDGVDWVSAHHANPAVANMSLAGPADTAIDHAVQNLIANGVTVVVAAANNGTNACNFSPARVPEAITVAATDSTDARASFSNFGTCVDLFAPGKDILSDYNRSDDDTATESGTSMASPFVAGVAALLRQRHPGDSPLRVSDSLRVEATSNVVSNPGTGSPNKLLFSSPPPAFSASISGPSVITTAGYYTWSASQANGVAPYTYQWEIAYDQFGSNNFGVLGTGSSVTFRVEGDGDFTLRLTERSADGQTAVALHRVTDATGGSTCVICE